MESPRLKKCGVCNASSTSPLVCGRCKLAYFCNEDCQKRGWPSHRHVCRKPVINTLQIMPASSFKKDQRARVRGIRRYLQQAESGFLELDRFNDLEKNIQPTKMAAFRAELAAGRVILEELHTLVNNPKDEIGFLPKGSTDGQWVWMNASDPGERIKCMDRGIEEGQLNPDGSLSLKFATDYQISVIDDKMEQLMTNSTSIITAINSMLLKMTDDQLEHECAQCGGMPALNRCGKCHLTWYCSKKCQASHWHHHKRICAVILEDDWENYESGDDMLRDFKEALRRGDPSMSAEEKLMLGIFMSMPRTVNRLLDDGADPNARLSSHVCSAEYDAIYDSLEFPLLEAAKTGSVSILRALILRGADVNRITLNKGGRGNCTHSALLQAVRRGHTEAVRLLINSGADCKFADSNGATGLLLACWEGFPEIASLLIAADSEINQRDSIGCSPLHNACSALHTGSLKVGPSRKHTACVKLLVAAGAMVNTISDNGSTPIIYAVQAGDTELVSVLMRAGADPLLVQKAGMTNAAQIAAGLGNEEIVRLVHGGTRV